MFGMAPAPPSLVVVAFPSAPSEQYGLQLCPFFALSLCLVAVWQPGSGIAVHKVKCGVFRLFFCLFHNPYWSVFLRHTQGRLVTV